TIELGRSIVSVTKRFLKKEIFKPFIRGAIHPRLKKARLSAPLTPFSVRRLRSVRIILLSFHKHFENWN
ncbi:hypothetical protein, partial [Sulfuracidifex metallicus]|uniref:hypothetical protein n=1 Tax=Sulfuracidifex metallicus TaxID=47303 RepID=UPI001C47A0DB